MNLKKIGLTALAGSLVATSVFAGEMTVTGSASMKVEHVNGGAANAGKSFSMGNQLEFAGSGELDNGLTVSLNFVLDQNDDATTTQVTTWNSGTPFDSHSVSVSSDALGTLVFHGEGGSSAQGAIDTTAAGDLWDSSFGITAAQDPKASAMTDNSIFYTLPTLVDGVALTTSYSPKGTGAEANMAFGLGYTGVEGLSLNYAVGEDNSAANAVTVDVTTMKASYAYGPITVGYSDTEYDGSSLTTTVDQDVTSYNVSYTVSENISVSYGSETISQPNDTTDQDIEVSGITASYTTGGMTISTSMLDADNTAHGTAVTEDKSQWSLVASFAF